MVKGVAYTEIFAENSIRALVPMGRALVLSQVYDGGRSEVGRLERIDVTIGRDTGVNIPGGEITLNSTGVSRQHGIFAPRGQHWFFRDLGSMNGSWLNREKLVPEKWYLIKPGDMLQLADIVIEIDDAGPTGRLGLPTVDVRSLIVFSRGEYLEEYPVPEFGRALVIGGSKADLRFDVDIQELPSLVVERRGDQVVAFTIAREMTAYHNNAEVTHAIILKDRDELRVGHYIIVYNDISVEAGTDNSIQRGNGAHADTDDYQQQGGHASEREQGGQYQWDSDSPGDAEEGDWEERASAQLSGLSSDRPGAKLWAKTGGEPDVSLVAARSARVSEKLPFGRDPGASAPGVNETIAIDASEMQARLSGYDRHPGSRQSFSGEPEVSLETVEDKIILFVGVLMLLALVGLVVWWAVL